MKISELETYKTINVLILAFIIIFFINKELIFLILAAILLVNNLFFININKVIADYWLAFSKVLGSINSKIILFLIFFIFLTPISFLYRIFNSEHVKKFKINNKESYFEDAEKNLTKEDLVKQW